MWVLGMSTALVIGFLVYGAAIFWVLVFGRLARRFGIVDAPGVFKVHQREVPLMGGVGVMAAAAMGILLWSLLGGGMGGVVLGLLLGGAAFCAIGFLDDVRGLSVRTRFWLEAGVAFGALLLLAPPVEGGLFVWVWAVLGTFFVVGLANAVNMLDGLDGLAGGVTGIALAALGFALHAAGAVDACVVALFLAAAWLGFLRFNKPPARVFMGSSGALFAGFSLGYLGLAAISSAQGALWSFLAVAFALWIPLFDAANVIFSRLRRGVSIFQKDNYHIHHRLMAAGFSRRQTVVFILVLGGMGGVASVGVAPGSPTTALIMPSIFAGVVALLLLHYRMARGAVDFRLIRREMVTSNGRCVLVSQFRVEERSGAVHVETYIERLDEDGTTTMLARLVSHEEEAQAIWERMVEQARTTFMP